MAFQEIVNFGLHTKDSPWSAINFYEILGVSRIATKDMDEDDFENVIIEAWAKRLVDIPTVSANMDASSD